MLSKADSFFVVILQLVTSWWLQNWMWAWRYKAAIQTHSQAQLSLKFWWVQRGLLMMGGQSGTWTLMRQKEMVYICLKSVMGLRSAYSEDIIHRQQFHSAVWEQFHPSFAPISSASTLASAWQHSKQNLLQDWWNLLADITNTSTEVQKNKQRRAGSLVAPQ